MGNSEDSSSCRPARPARHTLALTTAVLAALWAFGPGAAVAFGQYRVGEEVEVFFLNKWWPGKIVETGRRGEVMAEYEFAGRAQRRTFKRPEIRRKYEADALMPGRNWSDSSGQFNILAALVAIEDEQVILRKPDMAEVQVPINKLSGSDQALIRRMQKEAGPAPSRAPKPPPLEEFSHSQLSLSPPFGGTQRTALTPDPLPSFVKLKEGGAAFAQEEFFDQLGAVLPIGGGDGWLLAALESNNPRDEQPTRLLWASLERQKIDGRQVLPAGEVVLDYNAISRRLLTYAEGKSSGSLRGSAALTVWEVMPADQQAKPLVRWNVEPEKDRPRTVWARLAQGDIVVQRYNRHEFVGWDVAGKRMVYRISQESFFAPDPTLSGGRKYLLVPEDKGVRIFETATGKPLGTLPSDDGASAVAVSEDGQRAAVLGKSTLTVWDLTNPDAAPQSYQAEAIGTPFQAKLSWIGSERVIVDRGHQGQVLFSLPHEVALWNYEFDMSAVRETDNRRVREVVANHLVYAATFSQGTEKGFAVGAVRLPGPKVDELAQSLDRESLMIVKPGARVRLDIRAGNETARVQSALTSKIQANQWVLAPDAPAVLIAEMKRGEAQRVTYEVGFGGGAREQTVTVTPFISALRLEVNGKVAWQSGTSTGAPPVVTLEEGQSVQSEVDRWQKPDPEFYERVSIPQRILDPDKRNGLGTTQVTNRGLVPK